MEAGFMRAVEVGQYFVTTDTGDFRQFHSVANREYIIPREPRGWIQGNTRIGFIIRSNDQLCLR